MFIFNIYFFLFFSFFFLFFFFFFFSFCVVGEKSSFHWSDFRINSKTATVTIYNPNDPMDESIASIASIAPSFKETLVHDDTIWSSPFTLDNMGDMILSLFNGSESKRRNVKLIITESLEFGSIIISIEDEW